MNRQKNGSLVPIKKSWLYNSLFTTHSLLISLQWVTALHSIWNLTEWVVWKKIVTRQKRRGFNSFRSRLKKRGVFSPNLGNKLPLKMPMCVTETRYLTAEPTKCISKEKCRRFFRKCKIVPNYCTVRRVFFQTSVVRHCYFFSGWNGQDTLLWQAWIFWLKYLIGCVKPNARRLTHLASDHTHSFTNQKGLSYQIIELENSGLP